MCSLSCSPVTPPLPAPIKAARSPWSGSVPSRRRYSPVIYTAISPARRCINIWSQDAGWAQVSSSLSGRSNPARDVKQSCLTNNVPPDGWCWACTFHVVTERGMQTLHRCRLGATTGFSQRFITTRSHRCVPGPSI